MRISSVTTILLVLVFSCESNTMVDIQGHRGFRGLLPENSLPAFKKAVELGVHTLELDFAVTKDNEIIVSHEPFMSRTICSLPNGNHISPEDDMKFNLYQMTHDSIKQFDCGSKKHPRFPDQKQSSVYKPLLLEVFETADGINPGIKYNIELKAKPEYDNVYTPNPKDFVSLVLSELKASGVFKRCNLQSFDLRILEEIRRQDSEIAVALLVDENESINTKLQKLSYVPEIISPYYKLLDPKIVLAIKATNFQVIPWTVNSVVDMQQMLDYKVDGIITDYPDRLINVLNK